MTTRDVPGSLPNGSMRYPVAGSPATFHRHRWPGSKSVTVKASHTPISVCTRPSERAPTWRSSHSTAATVGPHSAHRVVSVTRSHVVSAGAGTTRSTSKVSRRAVALQPFDDHGHALAAADAHRLQPVGLVE